MSDSVGMGAGGVSLKSFLLDRAFFVGELNGENRASLLSFLASGLTEYINIT